MIFIQLLISMLTLPVLITRNIIRSNGEVEDEDRWLSDGIFYDYMADSPVGITSDQFEDKCPPVPDSLVKGSCDATTCNSDRECRDESFKCCYNGCTYTCRPKVRPAPFVDWIQEPRRRLSSGSSWLISGPDKDSEVEICSTSPVESDEDPLLCPHGYICNIDDNGQPEKGIPNRGSCIKQVDDKIIDIPEEEVNVTQTVDKEVTNKDLEYKINGCLLDNQLILEQASLTHNGQMCHCKHGVLKCK